MADTVRNEDQTRSELIDPILRERGWSGDFVGTEVQTGRASTRGKLSLGRADYVLYANVAGRRRPVAVLEAKATDVPADAGAAQAADYARALAVESAFATNGQEFVEVDVQTGRIVRRRSLDEFPSRAELQYSAVDQDREEQESERQEQPLVDQTPISPRRPLTMREAGEIPPWGRRGATQRGAPCPACGLKPDNEFFCAKCDALLVDETATWFAANRGVRLWSYGLEYLLFVLTLGVGWFGWWGDGDKSGQTPAKRATRLYVQFHGEDGLGKPAEVMMGREAAWRLLVVGVSVGLFFVHPVLVVLPLVLDGIWILGANRQTLHDRLSSTLVVRRVVAWQPEATTSDSQGEHGGTSTDSKLLDRSLTADRQQVRDAERVESNRASGDHSDVVDSTSVAHWRTEAAFVALQRLGWRDIVLNGVEFRLSVLVGGRPEVVAVMVVVDDQRISRASVDRAARIAEADNLPWAFVTNGKVFVGYDLQDAQADSPCPLYEFPRSDDVRLRYIDLPRR